MKSYQKYFSACLLALLTQAAFAQSAPTLGSASSFAVLSAASASGGAVTITDSAITGDAGTSGLAASYMNTRSTVSGAITAPVSAQVLTDLNGAYDALAAVSCTQTLTGTLAGVTLRPGVYCFDAAAAPTGTLTLDGPANGIWLFKIGTGGTGALTGTNFSVELANGASVCNVTWWAAQAATMTDSHFKGNILAGTAITMTRGTFGGRALAKAAVTFTGVVATGCDPANWYQGTPNPFL